MVDNKSNNAESLENPSPSSLADSQNIPAANDPVILDIANPDGSTRPPGEEFSDRAIDEVRLHDGNTATLEADGIAAAIVSDTNRKAETSSELPEAIQELSGADEQRHGMPSEDDEKKLDPRIIDQIRDQGGNTLKIHEESMTEFDKDMANIQIEGDQDIRGTDDTGLQGRTGAKDQELGPDTDDVSANVTTPALLNKLVENVERELNSNPTKAATIPEVTTQGEIAAEAGARIEDITLNTSDIGDITPRPVGIEQEKQQTVER